MFRFLLIGVLFFCLSANAHFSNLIVFGDSLSDCGNFPESSQIWRHKNEKKELSNLIPQLYVPFSNPVDIQMDNPYLPKQVPIENENHPRLYRSISWPQYFLMDAKNKKWVTSDYIAPSSLLRLQQIPNTISYDYAWGYAISAAHCVNPKYMPIAHCNENSIFTAQQNYLKNPSKDNYLKIEAPGLLQQIQLFLNDYHHQKVIVDKDTIYIVWIGGNDLIVVGNALLQHLDPFPALRFMMGETVRHVLQSITILVQELPIDQRPTKIYVFTLFNPSLTPSFYNKKIAVVGDFLVHCYNFWLKIDSMLYNLFSKTKIVVVPVDRWYQENASKPAFQAQIGKACQLSYNPEKISAQTCDGFMFWNAVHPSTQMNAIVAHRFQAMLLN